MDPDKKMGGYQITLPNPAGGILDRLPCRLPVQRIVVSEEYKWTLNRILRHQGPWKLAKDEDTDILKCKGKIHAYEPVFTQTDTLQRN
jgi:hypothetical protein